jgi:hypothetical protein
MQKLFFFVAILLAALVPGVALACPTYENVGRQQMQYTGEQLWTPQTTKVTAGGNVDVGNCRGLPNSARGYFMSQPDFTVYVEGIGRYALEFRVVSECDSNLLVNTGNGNWFYDDDDNGNLDPKIRLTDPSGGRYDIWIGTYDGEYCNAQLTLETF